MKTIAHILKNEKALVLADQAIFSGTGFFATLFLARILTTQNFGIYSGVILIVYLILSITNAIVIQPLQVSFHKMSDKNQYLTFTLLLQLVLNIVLSSGFYLVTLIPGLEWAKEINWSVSFFSFMFLTFDYFRKTFLATNGLLKALKIDFLNLASYACAILYLFSQPNLTLKATFFLLALTYLPSILYSLFNLPLTKLNTGACKSLSIMQFSQAGWLILAASLQWLSSNFFIMVSGIYLGIEALGAFRFVQSLFGVLNVLLQTFENYVLPKVAGLYNTSVESSKLYLRKITIQGFLIFAFILGILSVFSKEVIELGAGSKYTQYHYVVKLMSLLYLVIYIGYPIRLSIRMLVLNKSFFSGYLISFVFSLLSFHLLIKYGHLAGCVTGLVLNQLLMIMYWQYILTLKKFNLWK